MYNVKYVWIIAYYSILFCAIKGDIDRSICNGSATIVPPPMPELNPSYYGILEWKLLHENSTISVHEYKDGINKISSLHIDMKGEQIQLILDESALYQSILVTKDGCTVDSILSELVFAENEIWLTTLQKLYQIMQKTGVVYKGATMIRSIQVSQWHSCMYLYEYDMTLQMDIYFANSGWAMALSPPTVMVPVRIELMGTRRYNNTSERIPFHVVGDYVNFKPSPDFDQQMLQPPPGVFCSGRFPGKTLLAVPSSFSALIEKVDMDYKQISYQSLWFDAQHRFIRFDTKEANGADSDPTSVVSDFVTGVKYKIDRFIGTCSPYLLRHGDDFVVNAYIQKSPAVKMIDSSEFFHMERATVIYVGKRKARDIYCDVWSGIYYDYDVNKNVTVEWYFTEQGWTEAVSLALNPGSLIRMDIWNAGSTNPIVYNILQLDPLVPSLSVFDLANCYPPKNKTHFVIKFEVVTGGQTLSSLSYSYLKNTLQDNLAKQAAINAPRFADVVLEYSNSKDFFFIGTLLDKAPMLNSQIFPPPPTQHYLDAAFSFLHGLIEGGYMFNITNSIGQAVTLRGIDVIKIPYSDEFITTTTKKIPTSTFLVPPIPNTGSKQPTPGIPTPSKSTPEPTPPFIPLATSSVSHVQSTTKPSPTGTTPSTQTATKSRQTATTINCQQDNTKSTQSPTIKTTQLPVKSYPPCVCPKVTCPKNTVPQSKPTITCPQVRCAPATTQRVTPVPISPSSTSAKPTGKSISSPLKSNDDSGKVSSGGAAGIAIGMIIVGILIGIAGTIVYQLKFRNGMRKPLINDYADDERY